MLWLLNSRDVLQIFLEINKACRLRGFRACMRACVRACVRVDYELV